MQETELTIGQLAAAAGVNVETVRYYQRVGLIKQPRKPLNGIRHYPSATAGRIKFIKRAQQLGFTLQEISDLLELGDGRCRDVRHRAEAKRTQIDAQIADLQALRATLDALIHACRRGKENPTCPIVDALAGEPAPSD